MVDGPTAGRLHLLGEGDRIIGRGETADIKIEDPLVSQEHARVTRRADAYYLIDLGSRNGTAVNGSRVHEVRLRSKDRVRIATTNVLFLEEDRGESTQTIAIYDDEPALPQRNMGTTLFRQLPPGPEPEEENPAITLLKQAIALGRFVWRNRWALIPLPLLGLLLGVVSILKFPPPESATAVVKLTQAEHENPMDERRRTYGRGGPPPVFFEDPERHFKNPELVQRTLESMGVRVDDAQASAALGGLSIEGTRTGLYHATFSQPMFTKLPVATVGFLEQYLDAYLVSEVDKQIRVFKAEASFLETELREVEGELHAVEDELLEYRRKHIDSLPEKAHSAIAGQQALAMRRAELELEVERMAMQAANARERLNKSETTLVRRFQDTRPLQNQIDGLQGQIDALKARGLTEDHPDVRKLRTQIDGLKQQMNTKLTSEMTEIEDQGDPARIALRDEVSASEGNLRVARKALERVNQQLGAASGKVADVPEVEATVLRLTRRQDSLQKLRAQLFEQHRKAQVQIDLETANVRARYEVVKSAALSSPFTPKFLGIRIGGCFAVGLVLALLITGVLEARRLMKRHPELLQA